jgi:hypothetical protein
MALTHSETIEVKRIKGKGRGVFARRVIRAGEVIERVPVLVLPLGTVTESDGCESLAGYCFMWGQGTVALALGYGSLYNHSFRPNAKYEDIGQMTKVFTALREIAPGEEVTVNYNGDPADLGAVGFEVIEDAPRPARAAARRG